ncbi:hypothetical protein QQF64_033907 [Cirrhinus molitorella]|uniref:Uncharacterized protein n=1 Tax=Cirrhinus molitorella TaxID=172907 RepID=A0ABR3MVA7_9TELE
MAPMEWKPRTAKKNQGDIKKIILEEAPPQIIVTGTEGYDELLKLGQETFWSDKERGECVYSLPSRWDENQARSTVPKPSQIRQPLLGQSWLTSGLPLPAHSRIDQFSKTAVLTDWGLANIRDTVMLRQGSRLTGGCIRPMGGTFLYMAPECLIEGFKEF